MIALLFVGGLLSVVAGIWFLVESFKVSVLWGLLCLFVPFAPLVFLVLNWDRAKRPFLIGLAAAVIMVVGAYPMIREAQRLQSTNIEVAAPSEP